MRRRSRRSSTRICSACDVARAGAGAGVGVGVGVGFSFSFSFSFSVGVGVDVSFRYGCGTNLKPHGSRAAPRHPALRSVSRASSPPPSARLFSVSVPPIASASCRAIARPSPVPPVSRLRDVSTRRNGSNTASS